MKIDWAALGLVSVVSLVATVVVVVIAAAGVAAFDNASGRSKLNQPTAMYRVLGYLCVTVASAFVLFGIYLIVPAFH
jgi:uncharacterized BrkB/YihY/UPF0761 family membrane protein